MNAGAGFTVHLLSVADVLQVAARLLPAQVRLLLGVQPAVRISAQLRAGRYAAGGDVPHLCLAVGWRTGRGERLKPGSGSDGSPDPSDEKPPVSTIPAAQEARPHSSVLLDPAGLVCPRRGAVSRDGLCHFPPVV